MRKYLLVVFCFLLSNSLWAQPISNAPEQNCPGAIVVCHGDYQQNQAYSGSGTYNELTTSPCPNGNSGALYSGEKNGVWYQVNVLCSGYLCFTIEPNNPTDDYDWAMWDITGGGCSLIYNYTSMTTNPYPPYQSTCVPSYFQGCSNYEPNLGFLGYTGLSNNAAILSANLMMNQAPLVTAGQTFVILVSNFTSSNSGYHLTFDSSTACLYDTVKPTFTSVGSKCGYTTDLLNVTMSVPVLCSSLAGDGSNFYITNAATNQKVAGVTVTSTASPNCSTLIATNSYALQFSTSIPPGTYWLHDTVGTNGTTPTDQCNNFQSIYDSIEFTLVTPDPPVVISLDTPACYKARIIFDRGVKCSTIASDGSNLLITGGNGPLPDTVKISKVLTVSCNDNGLVDTIDVFFNSSIVTPGPYTVNFVQGTNGTFISDTCAQVVVSTPVFYVSDGGVTATAYPNLLCAPGYFNLGAATVMLPPPPPIVNCGANGTACTNGVGYQAGTGTNNMTAKQSPFGGAYTQRRTRMLYKASELAALGVTSGTFSQLAFNITTKGSTKAFQNLTIKMGCTADSIIDTSQNFPAAFTPALEIVYGPKNYTTTTGWNYFTLDNTYDWSNTQNLLVEICYSDSTGIGDDIVQGTSIPNQTFSVYTSASTVPGCALSSVSGVLDTIRPNMQFVECAQDTTPKFNWTWTPSYFLHDGHADSTWAYAFQTTTYTATIFDKDYCYRRDTALLIVSVRNPQLTPLDTALCIGDTVVLYAGGGVTYQWYPSTGLSCSTCTTPTVNIDTTTIFHIGIYDQYGCGDTLLSTVVINNLPKITVTPKDTLAIYGTPVQLQAYAPGGQFYIWNPAVGLDNPDGPNPQAIPDTNTAYIVTVIDTNHCSNKDTLTVRIYERGVEIPTAFTPNGDGKNDVFRIANLTTQKVAEFRVFNRWGQEVFDGHNSNQGWDGTFNGVEQPIGAYNFLIRVTFHDGSLKTYMGSVTLIR